MTPPDEARTQIAAVIRMLVEAEIVDFNGHASARTGPNSFMINSGRSVRSALTSDDIIEINLDGHLVKGTDEPPMEFQLHAGIYRRRPDVAAIIHAHPQWSTYLSMTGHPYEPVFPQGALLGLPPVFPDMLSVNTRERGDKLAETLGEGPAVLLRSHGTTVVAADMVQCFALCVYLEENARRQYMARQIGTATVLDAAEIQASVETLSKPNLYRKTWDFYFARALG